MLLTVFLTVTVLHADSFISNGTFQQGLTGWTPFTTPGGTLGPSDPQVVAFSPDNTNFYDAAQFQVGQATPNFNPTDLQGGGIYQNVLLPTGNIQLTVDIAAVGGTSTNLYGGYAQLLIDMQPVAGYDFGALQAGQIKTAVLTVQELEAGGTHSVGIEFQRGAGADNSTPYQYAYQFEGDTETPEPSTFGLMLTALAGCLWLYRRRRASAA